MSVQDFVNAGSQIASSVDEHLKRGDFNGLSKEIAVIAGTAARQTFDQVKNQASSFGKNSANSQQPAPDVRERMQNAKLQAQNADWQTQNVNQQTQHTNSPAQNVNRQAQNMNQQTQNTNPPAQNVNRQTQNMNQQTQNTNSPAQNVNRQTQNMNQRAQQPGFRQPKYSSQRNPSHQPEYSSQKAGKYNHKMQNNPIIKKSAAQLPDTFNPKPFSHLGPGIGFGVSIGLTGIFGILTILCGAASTVAFTDIQNLFYFFTAVFGIGTGASIFGIVRNWKKLSLRKSMRKYAQIIGSRTFISVSELASILNYEAGTVLSDIKKLIKNNFIPQGQLNSKENTLFLTSQAYEKYLTDESNRAKEKAHMDSMPEEVKKLLNEGKRYIAEINRCNDAIPGDSISRKLYQMEEITQRIFDQVKKEPASAPDLRKMMEYYLPTTIKMLNAYIDLDKQVSAGFEIHDVNATKQEIEDAVDTMNAAFEQLLSDMIRNQTWDVRSDISVMKTMLAQDGLVDNDFNK